MIVIGIERSPASASWSLKSLSSALPELTEPASPIVNVGWRAATVLVVARIASIFFSAAFFSPLMSHCTIAACPSCEMRADCPRP